MMSQKTLQAVVSALGFIVLTLGAHAQLVEKFNPPEEDCCPRIDAQRLADHFQDVNQLGYYHAANELLKSQPQDPHRVVFLGDSITEGWKIPNSFPGKPYINRGVSGQTTSQMLVRTFQDVIDLHPAVVIILAGTNDIAANNGSETMEMVEENFQAITELAQKHGIKVILCSILPVSNYTNQPQTPRHPTEQIVALNNWIRGFAAQSGALYCDYYSAVVDQMNFLKEGLSEDGLHPNSQGYAILAPIAQTAIDKELAQ
jgi:lysophospholipase L1-like esterase